MSALDNYHNLQGLQAIKNEPDQHQALKKVAKQFESLFLNELLKTMRKANEAFEEGGMFNSSESKHFQQMYDQQLTLQLSSGRGLGIADILYKQLSSRYASDSPGETENDRQSGGMGEKQTRLNETAPVAKPSTDTTTMSSPLSKDNFVQQLLPIAERISKSLGVNPLVLLAQSALETGWGKHTLKSVSGEDSHNLFNIKAGGQWRGETVVKDVVEYRDGVATKEKSAFRKYASFEESFEDFKNFLLTQPRYAESLNEAGDERRFVQALQSAGYATDPQYAGKVLDIYQRLAAGQTTDNVSR